MLLAPQELQMPTKTLQFDESVMLDHPICLKLVRSLARLRARKLVPNVWGITHQEFLGRCSRQLFRMQACDRKMCTRIR